MEHTGHADEVAGLIVKPLAAPQGLEHKDAHRREQAVGAHDHQKHRHKVEHERVHAGAGGDGDIVAGPQGEDAQKGHEPPGLGLPLPGAGAVEQLDGLGQADLVQVAQQHQQQHPGEHARCEGHAGPGDIEPKGRGHEKHLVQAQVHQLVKDQPRGQSAQDARRAHVQGLVHQHQGDMALAHAQDVVQSQLLFPLLHEKAVDVVHKDEGEQEGDDHADGHEGLHVHIRVGPARDDILHARIAHQGGHDIHRRHVPDEGQDIGEVELPVVADAAAALGAEYAGKSLSKIADLTVFSFNGNKIITTGGGGALVAKKTEDVEHLRYLSAQAKDDPLYYIHHEIGYNYRMTNLQAALGVAQMEELPEFIRRKQKNYQLYQSLFETFPLGTLMPFREGTESNHWFYSLKIEIEKINGELRGIIERLQEKGIQTRPVWGLIHEQKPYQGEIAYQIEKAVYYSQRVLNIPCSTQITEDEIHYAAEGIMRTIEEMAI